LEMLEMLMTMLIIGLAAALMATGIPVAADTYQKTVKSANAQLALSTTISALKSELGLATIVKADPSNSEMVVYYRADINRWASISNPSSTGNHGLMRSYYYSEPVAGALPDSGSYYESLISDEAFTKDLTVKISSVTWNSSKKTVGLVIEVNSGSDVLASTGDDPYCILARFAE